MLITFRKQGSSMSCHRATILDLASSVNLKPMCHVPVLKGADVSIRGIVGVGAGIPPTSYLQRLPASRPLSDRPTGELCASGGDAVRRAAGGFPLV